MGQVLIDSAASALPREVALRVTGVSKTFFDTPVLRDVDLEVRKGEVHCLAGGNGSGKSTLIKVVSGVHHAEAGLIQGPHGGSIEAHRINSAAATELGIHTVHQEPSVFATLTVADNLMLGRGFPLRGGRIDHRAVRERSTALLQRFRIPARPEDIVGELPAAVQTLVAIARALQDSLHSSEGVLVLDEPTASLAADEVASLLEALRGYAADGQAIVLVTHRLEEVLSIADRVTVLRDGAVVATVEGSSLDRSTLAEMIVGRALMEEDVRSVNGPHAGAPILRLIDVAAGPIKNVSFTLHSGEILGVASLLGGGASELAETAFGLHPISAGSMEVDGTSILRGHPKAMIERGVALVPRDRTRDAAFSSLAVRTNVSAGSFRAYWRRGLMRRGAERVDSRRLLDNFNVKPRDPEATMSSLSGGNQQKVVLARHLRRSPRLLLLDEPTQGVDVGARLDLHQQIRAAVDAGAAALLASTDLDELIRLSDRIIVLAGGVVVADKPAQELQSKEIVSLMNSRPSAVDGVLA